MINFVIGPVGSGKTGELVDKLNTMAVDDTLNVVCLERGRRLDRQVKPQIRLVDVSEYPVSGYPQLLSFIAGIAAKDFDISELFIDSINKVSESDDMEELTRFVEELKTFTDEHEFNVTILLSTTKGEMPEALHQYVQTEK